MKGYIFSAQASLFGQPDVVGFGDEAFRVQELDRLRANTIIIENHYSKKFYNASYIHLGVYKDDRLIGVLQLGYAMNPASMSGVVKDTKIDEYLELNRMWFIDNEGRNLKSRAISYAIKFIKRKYPKIQWIQSFADERCNKFGVVYQAANFLYVGEHLATFWLLDGVWYHNIIMTAKRGKGGSKEKYLQANKDRAERHDLRQFRYIFFIKRNTMKNLLLPITPAPKHYDVNNQPSRFDIADGRKQNRGGSSV